MSAVTRKTALTMLLVACGMFGFGFAMVPIYNVFCKVTGLNGKTDDTPYNYDPAEAKVDESRTIKVQFLATNNAGMSWEFGPSVHQLAVHPGEPGLLSFTAKNPTNKKMIAQAIPSVTPFEATEYLHKVECFCFDIQHLGAGEFMEMPLRIIIDQDLPKYIHKLTLSYTLFDVTHLY